VTAFYSADSHFAHALVAGLRGFASQEEHDEAVIDSWNAVVKPADLVWHLGDVGLGSEARVLELAGRLNGVKHLIAGNHDRCWPGHRDARKRQRAWLDAFESVQAFAKARIDGRTVLLSHLPYQDAGDHTAEERYPQFRLPDLGEWLIHGHTHSHLRVDGPRSVHVGLDAWGLRPVSEGEITALIREAEGTGGTSRARRRHLIRSTSDGVPDSAIYERDAWTCRMPACQAQKSLGPERRAIDAALSGTDSPWAPSVDHVIALVLGGTDTAENKRAAHRCCNNAGRPRQRRQEDGAC
jgi:calcineurin-like phosphoesterase family protein